MACVIPAQPAHARTLVGAVLSRRFRLLQKLGDGGMGEVYAAEAIAEPGKKLAVKILHPDFLSEATVLSRFLEEGKTCQRLIHPNIVRVFESAEAEDGSPYIVMELLEGVPLSAYTQNGGRVPVQQASPILQGILGGLAAAHSQGIVHRDLKPDNVFLTRSPQGHFVVKLLDFGIAKVMDEAGGMGNKTRTGMLLGTPAYMSPEQIKSAKDVDARADLWSAGVMFYEMITGKVAFPAPTEYARLSAVLTTTPDPVEKVDPQLAPLSTFTARALQKDREIRFQSALEMSRALGAVTTSADAPLSRLPEVPSLFVPSVNLTSNAVPTAQAIPTPQVASAPETLPRIPSKAPGGTLASPSSPIPFDGVVTAAPSPVVLVAPHGGGETLPSKDLPILPAVKSGAPRLRSGMSPAVVATLVLAGLLVGFVAGFFVGRA